MFVWQGNIVDTAGNVLPSAQVTVRHQVVGNLASLFEDVDGNTPLSNPFNADSLGFARFFVDFGIYRIEATSGGFSRVLEYVLIGNPDGGLIVSGIGTASIAPGETNNLPEGLDGLARLHLTGSAGAELTGMLAPPIDGITKIITNVGSPTIILRDESTSSSAANRFAMNGDLLLPASASAKFIYVEDLNRWSHLG